MRKSQSIEIALATMKLKIYRRKTIAIVDLIKQLFVLL
jgi:hypothetical protein